MKKVYLLLLLTLVHHGASQCGDGSFNTVPVLTGADQCRTCDSSCATCLFLESCTTCANGYWFDSGTADEDLCVACSEGCSDCSAAPPTCTACMDGYYFESGACVACHESCKTCDSDNGLCTNAAADGCASGYRYDAESSSEPGYDICCPEVGCDYCDIAQPPSGLCESPLEGFRVDTFVAVACPEGGIDCDASGNSACDYIARYTDENSAPGTVDCVKCNAVSGGSANCALCGDGSDWTGSGTAPTDCTTNIFLSDDPAAPTYTLDADEQGKAIQSDNFYSVFRASSSEEECLRFCSALDNCEVVQFGTSAGCKLWGWDNAISGAELTAVNTAATTVYNDIVTYNGATTPTRDNGDIDFTGLFTTFPGIKIFRKVVSVCDPRDLLGAVTPPSVDLDHFALSNNFWYSYAQACDGAVLVDDTCDAIAFLQDTNEAVYFTMGTVQCTDSGDYQINKGVCTGTCEQCGPYAPCEEIGPDASDSCVDYYTVGSTCVRCPANSDCGTGYEAGTGTGACGGTVTAGVWSSNQGTGLGGATCTERTCSDDTTANLCGANTECSNEGTGDGFKCSCLAGYSGDSAWNIPITCTVIACPANSEGTPPDVCTCKAGYSGGVTPTADPQGYSGSCDDINECDSSPCDTNADCSNTPGSYTCSCQDYYFDNGNAHPGDCVEFSCTAIDTSGTDAPCEGAVDKTCSDDGVGYTCGCELGYYGDDVQNGDSDCKACDPVYNLGSGAMYQCTGLVSAADVTCVTDSRIICEGACSSRCAAGFSYKDHGNCDACDVCESATVACSQGCLDQGYTSATAASCTLSPCPTADSGISDGDDDDDDDDDSDRRRRDDDDDDDDDCDDDDDSDRRRGNRGKKGGNSNILNLVSEGTACPNDCSGNGSCSATNVCRCEALFLGEDCSIEAQYSTFFGLNEMHWVINEDLGIAMIQLRYYGLGWGGFIFGTDDEQMANGDSWVFWVSNDHTEQVHVWDGYSMGQTAPTLDSINDLQDVSGYQTDTSTIVSFTRRLYTGNDDDVDMDSSLLNFGFCYAQSDPVDIMSLTMHTFAEGGYQMQWQESSTNSDSDDNTGDDSTNLTGGINNTKDSDKDSDKGTSDNSNPSNTTDNDGADNSDVDPEIDTSASGEDNNPSGEEGDDSSDKGDEETEVDKDSDNKLKIDRKHLDDYANYNYNKVDRRQERELEEKDDMKSRTAKAQDRVHSRHQSTSVDEMGQVQVDSIAEDGTDQFSMRLVATADRVAISVETPNGEGRHELLTEVIKLVEYDTTQGDSYLFTNEAQIIQEVVVGRDIGFGSFERLPNIKGGSALEPCVVRCFRTISSDGVLTLVARITDRNCEIDGVLLSPNRVKIDVEIKNFQYTPGRASSLALISRLRFEDEALYVSVRTMAQPEPTTIYSDVNIFDWRTVADVYTEDLESSSIHVAVSPLYPAVGIDASSEMPEGYSERLIAFSFLTTNQPNHLVWDPDLGVTYTSPVSQMIPVEPEGSVPEEPMFEPELPTYGGEEAPVNNACATSVPGLVVFALFLVQMF